MAENQENISGLKGQDLMRAVEDEYKAGERPDFGPGDSLEVGLRIKEGEVSRVQNFTGMCIARKGSGISETFTVRRMVQGEGVERVFPLHCPTIDHIKVLRRGKVRRAKLNYLRGLKGKGARVKGKLS